VLFSLGHSPKALAQLDGLPSAQQRSVSAQLLLLCSCLAWSLLSSEVLLCSCEDTGQPQQQERACRSVHAFMKFFALKVRCKRSRFSVSSSSDHPSTCGGRPRR